MSSLLFLLLGFVAGAVLAWFAGRASSTRLAVQAESLRSEAGALRLSEARLTAELASAQERLREVKAAAAAGEERRESLLRDLSAVSSQLAKAQAELDAERAAGPERLALVLGAKEELTNQFKTLAGEILEEKSKRFTDHNRENMDRLLGPLREKLGEFQLKVEGLQNDGVVGRTELRTHIETLAKLNDRLSAEASSLAAALKGSSKKQGDWGEVLLERMLEDAGLEPGREYRVQESFSREDGTRARPDVILNLPGDKHLVIDAKVSLVDYTAYCECDDEAARTLALARHIGSIREHLRGLAKRKYQALYQLQSIDFVVMFVPIEPAYLLALSKDGRLWQEAWESNILLVSPGTLFPVMRTVAHLWRQEQQNLNVQQIVDRGAQLYDKLNAFANDLLKVGAGLNSARDSYDEALKKLSTGRGNVIRQAEMLRELGIKPSKQLPRELVEVQEDLPLAEETGSIASE
jgi:DNA recombination protein RmuC